MAAQLQPLTQTFEALILALYRNWYGLPRKSTQFWLDDERAALARRLSDEEAVAAIGTFVQSLGKRPGVIERVGAYVAAVETSLRNPFLARLTPEVGTAWSALLTEREPVAYAFNQWIYLRGSAATTVENVRERLDESLLERLPKSVRDEVDTIFATLDKALGESEVGPEAPAWGATGQRLQAMIATLNALEALPDILRIAWRELLAGKAAAEPQTLGGAGLSPSLAAAPAPFVGRQTVASDAAPVADSEQATAEVQSFHTEVVFPERIKLGTETALTVRLTLGESATSRLQEIVEVQFADPAKPELVDVIVDAADFTERFDLWYRTMVVYSDRDSEPVTFLLTAQESAQVTQALPQTRMIRVTFYHAGKHIGQGTFAVTVGRDNVNAGTNVALGEGQNRVELRLVDLPPPADLELRVTHDSASQSLQFMLHSTKAAVGYHWRNMGSVTLREGKPHDYFNRQLEQLNEWGGLLAGDLYDGEAAEFTGKMENMGEELFEMLFPEALQTAYWNDIRAKQEAGIIQSLLITSDEPWIPWELVKPYRYDDVADEEHEADFLARSFQISRWLTGHGPYEQVTIDSAAIIAPDVGLSHAGGEAAYFKTLSEHGVVVGEELRTKAAVIQLLEAGKTRLLHVASHAGFNQEHPDASPLLLADADLLPEDLDRRVIRLWRTSRPLIFFNACETGRIEYKLTGLGGWADKFIRDVRATAFLGTLWEVNDALASEFARVFYDELLAGQPLGSACQRARLHIRDLAPANPTWLAYTLYGDPNTRVDWGTTDGVDESLADDGVGEAVDQAD